MFTHCHNGLLGTEIDIKNATNFLQGSTHFTEPHYFFVLSDKYGPQPLHKTALSK